MLKLKLGLFCVFMTTLSLNAWSGGGAKPSDSLTIYTSSNEEFIRPIFEKFTKESGIKINFIADKGPVLIERLKAEGSQSPADLLTTVDVGNLWLAAQAGLLAPIQSPELAANIPAQFRAPHNEWVGLSLRARTIFYNPKKVKVSQLSTYEDLALPKWKNKLCLRTSNNVYNQSLVAAFIEAWGEKKTESVLKGWIKNLAAPVFSSDTPMLEAIAAGQCVVGIGNSYYYARLLKDQPDIHVKLFWADQSGRGTHVNIMGGGVVKASKKKDLATQFLVWASGLEGQKMLSAMNHEFPVNPEAEIDALIKEFGAFKADDMPLVKAGENQRAAVQLMDRVGYK